MDHPIDVVPEAIDNEFLSTSFELLSQTMKNDFNTRLSFNEIDQETVVHLIEDDKENNPEIQSPNSKPSNSETIETKEKSVENTIRPARRSRRLLTMQATMIDNWSNQENDPIPIRKSKRLTTLGLRSTPPNDDDFVFAEPISKDRSVRRSTRISSVRSIYKTVPPKESSATIVAAQKPLKRLKDKFEETMPTVKKGQSKNDALAEHAKQIFKLFNSGSCKDLQMLPTIGQKTAYQIIVYRSINGKFKNFDGISKMPVWRGKGYERFKNVSFFFICIIFF